MGCTQSAAPGPRAVASSRTKEIPGAPKGAESKARHDAQGLGKAHEDDDSDQDSGNTSDAEEVRAGGGAGRGGDSGGGVPGGAGSSDLTKGVDVPEIDLEGLVAEVNTDRKRLSIMKSNHQDPRKLRPGLRMHRPSSSANGSGEVDLKDPGEDIGNGAFGENGVCETLKLAYSCVTRPGNDPAKRQKENQDTYCVQSCLDRDKESFSVMVFDGHGPNGAQASKYMREHLLRVWLDLGLGTPMCRSEEEIRRILHNGCVEMNHRLATSHIDVYVSGSTGIMGVMKKNKLYVANVGDSRAVLGRVSPTGQLEAVDLSEDQKPDRPDEHARIIRYGGRVFEWGVPRVWQRDVDMPGLAMARSFGDLAAEAVGVYAEPEVTVTELTKDDKFLIFATDGVWEFLSSSDVVKIIGKHVENKPAGQAARDACVEVIKMSVAKWNAVEDVVDDSTCVIIALHDDNESEIAPDANYPAGESTSEPL
ncbi:Protein phosphatase, putative [Hondaea fermentalgiana]|uniref:Protein phosphatase, putative n=1 Tax=Hondaea fermentalgiana TaxID=2315210 RepID=A0A2R5G8W9_9STRA|nr:Protein phosphatase, putative [Hondaea fermentalgiana]|eukprot:GBG26779.1 Protein phosphatase, putative [Hondaea fermentalgiana]